MQDLVRMQSASSARPQAAEDSRVVIEQFILPTLQLGKKLQEQKKILAGGPLSGAIAIVLVIEAESVQELDALLPMLPAWARMETEVVPLTTFDARMQTLRPGAERLKAKTRETGIAAAGAAR